MIPLQTPSHVRLDKWLWAVRLYKTRSQATAACDAGHVKLDSQHLKPARAVRVGEILHVLAGQIQRTVRVVGLLDQRVGAPRVAEFLEDLTPPEEYARAKEAARTAHVQFPKGWGRPTKKQRRQIDQIDQFLAEPSP